MGLPIVENLSGLSGNIFNLSRIPSRILSRGFIMHTLHVIIPRPGTELHGESKSICLPPSTRGISLTGLHGGISGESGNIKINGRFFDF